MRSPLLLLLLLSLLLTAPAATADAKHARGWKLRAFNSTEPQAYDDGLLVIGAGWGRTGTDSTRAALKLLGFGGGKDGEVYHMFVTFQNYDLPIWIEAGSESTSAADTKRVLHKVLKHYRAGVDFPMCSFWRELVQMYPNAVVLLNVRDSPQEWFASYDSTIGKHARCFRGSFSVDVFYCWGIYLFRTLTPPGRAFEEMERIMLKRVGLSKFTDEAAAIAAYESHIAEVKKTVPSDKLLVVNVKQGWDPLVSFLGVPKPSVDFPRVNDGAAITQKLNQLATVGWTALAVYLVLGAGVAWFVVRRLRGGSSSKPKAKSA